MGLLIWELFGYVSHLNGLHAYASHKSWSSCYVFIITDQEVTANVNVYLVLMICFFINTLTSLSIQLGMAMQLV